LFTAQQVHQDFTPLKVHAKAHLAQPFGLHGAAQIVLAFLGVEQEKATLRRAGILPPRAPLARAIS